MSRKDPTDDSDRLDRLIPETEAASFLGYSIRTLQAWRVRGGGPKFLKISARSVRYRKRDLMAWIEQRICANTIQGKAVVS